MDRPHADAERRSITLSAGPSFPKQGASCTLTLSLSCIAHPEQLHHGVNKGETTARRTLTGMRVGRSLVETEMNKAFSLGSAWSGTNEQMVQLYLHVRQCNSIGPALWVKTILAVRSVATSFACALRFTRSLPPHPLILQRNQAARKRLAFRQSEFPLRKPHREHRNPFANQHRHDSQIELIHQIFLQELPRQFPTADQPHILPLLLAQLFHNSLGFFAHKDSSVAFPFRQRPGENVAAQAMTLELPSTHAHPDLVCLSPHQSHINGLEERPHRVVRGPQVQEIQRPVQPRDIAIQASSHGINKLSHELLLAADRKITNRASETSFAFSFST